MKKILTKLTALTLALMMLCPLCVFAGESEIKSDVSFVKWNTYNSHTYSMYYGTKTWEEAQAWCESNGGHLVTITSEDEQNFIEYFNNVFAYLWIGAYRERVIDWEWKWVTGEAWDYTNWAEGEPNNSPNVVPDENCVVLWPMEWNDLSNENVYEQHGFICEWDRTLTEVPTEKPTEESTEKPTEEEYYFDIYIEGGIQIKEGEVYEVYIDTNSPLEVPYTLRSTNEKVFCVRDGYVYAVGGGEAELYIADNYYGMLYSYPVYVYGEDVEEPTEAPTEDKTEEPTEAPTEDGTEENTGEFLGHTYRVYHCSVTWEEAKTWCENNGGHLVTITSADEQQFIERLNESGQNLWIGAYREQRIDWTWSWVTGEVWEYTNWAAGEPNNSPNVVPDEYAVVTWPMAWNDLSGKNTAEQTGFICEWEYINPDTPEEGPNDSEKPTEGDDGTTEEKPDDDVTEEEIVKTPPAKVEMEVTTTLKPADPEDEDNEPEVTVHIELEALTEGKIEDSKVFIRATGADGVDSVQSLDGSGNLDVDVPASKRVVKVFCFDLVTLKPLCEAKLIEIEY